jgi:dihydrofolate reductase
MRRVRYSVACSLDGFLAGPNGEHDWIVMDPSIDFRALMAQFDTLLLGRRTFEFTRRQHPKGSGGMPGFRSFVFSRTLRAADHPGVTIRDDAIATVAELKQQPGKDIWLFGGGGLFKSLLDARLVDAVELAIVPVLLGAGIPLVSGPYARSELVLTSSRALPSGILMTTYEPAPARRATTGRKATAREPATERRR